MYMGMLINFVVVVEWSARKFKPLKIPDAQTKETVAQNRLPTLTLGEF